MDVLWLSPEQARMIARHAQNEAPHEACGLIGGVGGRAESVIPARNVSPRPETTYEIEPRALVDAMRQFGNAGESLIGLYHSHPVGPPTPSRSDITLATYPDTAYVIVGLRTGEPELAAWRIRHGSAERLALHIGVEPPPADSGPMSTAQKAAVILTALLAVATFLAIALSLLPPAPRIP